MTGRKVFMDFDVTDTSHTLADYKARGGYETLAKALREMQPEEVTKEVLAAGILGHGGAAFPPLPRQRGTRGPAGVAADAGESAPASGRRCGGRW